ncbi:molybdopterin-synthase adenylyltransferase MoeB [Kocuria rosea]|uniref:molybdopterin-synthase adenylyltransferase MoeB n=1 Tax=Kocuria rosea TaxID=1275 RepID=UPI00204160E8|nr:molybdopterin-synthase adenylyltransferase MoeB [Kocuria rosea]MCM3688965.1 molybdopterin-synthase adenylyltransferase MoeB [Kocuria rosea]HST72628.1 molybdopterin-synthase adenylyltransferase MoeB [Kocuria rosea]
MSPLPPLAAPAPGLTCEELERYARHLALAEVGSIGQRRLKNARVLVVGAGGLGAPALQYLAAAGVGTLGIVDDDVVTASNLQRQVIHTVADIGRPKVDSAADAVARLNPLVDVRTHPVRLTADNAVDLVGRYDLVLDGADNFATRYLVSDAAALTRTPVVWGSILRFEGQVSVFWAGHGPTYRDLYPESPPAGEVPSCAEGGVVGMLPATVGSVMVTEAVKLITGVGEPLLGRVLLHDALAMTWRELRLTPDPGAPPVVALESPQAVCARPGHGPGPAEVLGPQELAVLLTRRERGEAVFALVDVREAWERELVSIPGTVPVPLSELLERGADALPAEVLGMDLVLHCKAGARSATALAALRPHFAQREERLRHLEGGILAWVAQIEPGKPVY